MMNLSVLQPLLLSGSLTGEGPHAQPGGVLSAFLLPPSSLNYYRRSSCLPKDERLQLGLGEWEAGPGGAFPVWPDVPNSLSKAGGQIGLPLTGRKM